MPPQPSSNHEKLIRRARELRKNPTRLEQRLWKAYLGGYPLPFRRWAVIGRYIVAFYCREARTVIELVGDRQDVGVGRGDDKMRVKFLEAKGLRVLRFTEADIDRNFEEVLRKIDESVIMGSIRPFGPPPRSDFW